jgi:beta-galactosidase/beta-glucuronidase
MFREEYPRPSFVRKDWSCLNGEWEFEILKASDSDNDYLIKPSLMDKIQVPFCPESKLSGVQHKDFMEKLWYRRCFFISSNNIKGRVLLNFGAVDYSAAVYVNKKFVGNNQGGYVPFTIDITDAITEGNNVLDISITDDSKNTDFPSGKQSPRPMSYGCMYTRTTGIWQTVWLEYVPQSYINECHLIPDSDKAEIIIKGNVKGYGENINAKIFYGNKLVAEKTEQLKGDNFNLNLRINDLKLWDIGTPELYDIILTLEGTDDKPDEVKTYCGFRKFEIKDKHFYLNGRRIVLRQVLDQGFYPDGIYTAPSVKDIERDIDLAIEFGFNGARPHQKVFEEYYAYYADRKGFLVWGEFPDWGCNYKSKNMDAIHNLVSEWRRAVIRDRNHPSIIGWCPLNEAYLFSPHRTDYKAQKHIYTETKKLDDTRVIIGASGGEMFVSDIWDYHSYLHNEGQFSKLLKKGRLGSSNALIIFFLNLIGGRYLTRSKLRSLPVFVSEYGGLSYKCGDDKWGYHKEFMSEAELLNKYEVLTRAIIENDLDGFCYTQLYDVEQERNGLLTYNREQKLSTEGIARIRAANTAEGKING